MTKHTTLVVVSGPAGSGKTTLAHALARELGCPAICRDEIKEGLVFGRDHFEAAVDDSLTRSASELFFYVVTLLVQRGTTLVAEAAFQHHVWAPNLEPLRDSADLRIVQCESERGVALARIADRGDSRRAHADDSVVARGEAYFAEFQRVALDVPTITVDTTNGYEPSIDTVASFVRTG